MQLERGTCSVVIRPCPADRRARRVVLLLVVIAALSVLDLGLTLGHLTTTGMLEANPIAAWLIRTTGSAWLLSGFKLGTVLISVSLLYVARRHLQGEIAAWCGAAVLSIVGLMWIGYTHEMSDVNGLITIQDRFADQWLALGR